MSNFLARKKRIQVYEALKAKKLKETKIADSQKEIEDLARSCNITIMDYKANDDFKVTGEIGNLNKFWSEMKAKKLFVESVVSICESTESKPAIPENGESLGVSSMLNNLIKSEFDAIDDYNSAVATLTAFENSNYEGIIKIISDIAAEENMHVGQLQEALKTVNGQASLIADGEEEGREQLADSDDVAIAESVEDDVSSARDLGKIRAFIGSMEEVLEKSVTNSYADEGIDDLAMDIYETYVDMKGELLYLITVEDKPDEELTIWYIKPDSSEAVELFKGNSDAFVQEIKTPSVTSDNILDIIGVKEDEI